MKTWEQEKTYCAKRAQELEAELEAAIESHDKERFNRAYATAMRYMKHSQLAEFMRRFVANM